MLENRHLQLQLQNQNELLRDRVMAYIRDRLDDPLELLRKQVNDDHPRVRLEALRALSFFDGPSAAKAQEIALESLVHPQDDYLEYTLNETTKTLDQRTFNHNTGTATMDGVPNWVNVNNGAVFNNNATIEFARQTLLK